MSVQSLKSLPKNNLYFYNFGNPLILIVFIVFLKKYATESLQKDIINKVDELCWLNSRNHVSHFFHLEEAGHVLMRIHSTFVLANGIMNGKKVQFYAT